MANATVFYQQLNAAVRTFISALEALNEFNDRLASDAGLAAAAATAAQAQGRSDLVTADFTNIGSAITQLAFTFNSGTPTEKSYLYKIL